jgi:predicted phosphoadenosine phosphosulfate sulfurtransferase
MFKNNHGYYNTMRVSNLIHEKSFTSLVDLQELEPDTYNKVIKRIQGSHCASIYANEKFLYNPELPNSFSSWIDYRDYLLNTLDTTEDKKNKIKNRFKQTDSVNKIKQQIKQILINDWENNIPVTKEKSKEDIFRKWRNIL